MTWRRVAVLILAAFGLRGLARVWVDAMCRHGVDPFGGSEIPSE